jgi:hypothetical protein
VIAVAVFMSIRHQVALLHFLICLTFYEFIVKKDHVSFIFSAIVASKLDKLKPSNLKPSNLKPGNLKPGNLKPQQVSYLVLQTLLLFISKLILALIFVFICLG